VKPFPVHVGPERRLVGRAEQPGEPVVAGRILIE
jgi:hypothetical protein